MKLAIMQPYFFPYLGYFQLINHVDKFIFYDDVNFIKNGWINRNRILVNEKPHYITIQLKNASSFKLINCVEFTDNRNRIKKTIEQFYRRAHYFDAVWPVIEECLNFPTNSISELAVFTVLKVSEFIGIETQFEISSKCYSYTSGLEKTERLLEICKVNDATQYINPIGGIEIYNKSDFNNVGIDIQFIKPNEIVYKQFNNEFVPSLSIIDVMMFNSLEEISKMLDQYETI